MPPATTPLLDYPLQWVKNHAACGYSPVKAIPAPPCPDDGFRGYSRRPLAFPWHPHIP
jgi:hypothetical protein